MRDGKLLKILQEEFYNYEINSNFFDGGYYLKLKGCKNYIINVSYNKYDPDIRITIGESSGYVSLNIPLNHLQKIIKYYKKEIDEYVISYDKMMQSHEILHDFNFNRSTIIHQLIRDEKINKII